jgi:hypothetical protein
MTAVATAVKPWSDFSRRERRIKSACAFTGAATHEQNKEIMLFTKSSGIGSASFFEMI